MLYWQRVLPSKPLSSTFSMRSSPDGCMKRTAPTEVVDLLEAWRPEQDKWRLVWQWEGVSHLSAPPFLLSLPNPSPSSLPPPCPLHSTAAVRAGMAPLTICSLIANIRVHFLRHWTGTERWTPELWAFLPLSSPLLLSFPPPSLCLSYSGSALAAATIGTRTHWKTHRENLTATRWVI